MAGSIRLLKFLLLSNWLWSILFRGKSGFIHISLKGLLSDERAQSIHIIISKLLILFPLSYSCTNLSTCIVAISTRYEFKLVSLCYHTHLFLMLNVHSQLRHQCSQTGRPVPSRVHACYSWTSDSFKVYGEELKGSHRLLKVQRVFKSTQVQKSTPPLLMQWHRH